jgi:asparagine synthase (glutamine-hydrolysing)
VDRVFRGTREVVLLDGEAEFAALPPRDHRRLFLHGSPIGTTPEALAGRSRFDDVFGRFVLVVHDPGRRTLEIHTDRYGFAPLYRAETGGRLHLSTRLRPFVERKLAPEEPDLAGVADMLAFQLCLGERTLVSGVSNVEAGTTLTVDLDSLVTKRERTWDAADRLRAPRVPFADVQDELLELFLEAHRLCTADAERVAVTLSGGMDTRCLLAAVLHLGREVAAYHVGVEGSRAERYTRRIAGLCGVPLTALVLDAGFGGRYHDLLRRVVAASEGMKFVPQPEMLWLRDAIETPAVVLHGAFGEIAKLGVLRDYHLDDAALAADRRALPELLWRRFAPRLETNLRVFAPDVRPKLRESARAHWREKLDALDADLGVPEAMQVLYFDEFVKSARYGHRIWNERVPTRFPFMEPRFVDSLLRVRTEDRLEARFQLHALERIHPGLRRLPDENTGTSADAPRAWTALVRWADRARLALFGSTVEANHGDLLTWVQHMDPSPEALVEESGGDPLYDRASLEALVRDVRGVQGRSAPVRALALRRARQAAQALQTFYLTELARRFLRGADRDAVAG